MRWVAPDLGTVACTLNLYTEASQSQIQGEQGTCLVKSASLYTATIGGNGGGNSGGGGAEGCRRRRYTELFACQGKALTMMNGSTALIVPTHACMLTRVCNSITIYVRKGCSLCY
jgi:hypothetical protein